VAHRSSRIRSRSVVVTPDRTPPSTWALRTHLRNVSRVIPNFAEIEPIATHSNGYSPLCSSTSLTARSRSSCGYLVVLVVPPSSQRMESPPFPGRFKLRTDASRSPSWLASGGPPLRK